VSVMAPRPTRRPAAPVTDREADPLAAALEEVGDRWTLLVVDALLAGPRRFNELQADVPGIATNVLAKRLAQLEERSLAVATAYSARPPRFAYQLTEAGQELADALALLRRWGAAHAAGDGPVAAQPVHHDCGSALEPRWWCPTCERVVGEDEPPDLRYV
jgi:DNA-binding HxlR family transcriptional regulator